MGKNTKEEIIELIKNKKMTPEEGFKLINNIIANAPVKACYKEEWQKKENSYEVKKESLLNDNIIIFDENTNLRNDIQIESSSRIILVKASQQYKKLNHNEYIINPSKQDDYRRFLNDANIKGSIDILHKWSKNIENNDFDNLLNISINSMFYLFKELLKLKDKKELKLLYLHEGVEIQPQFSSVGSFLKTINIENPNYLCKSISISNFKDSSNILHIILEELREFNQEDIEIYYDKNNERFVRRYNLYNTKKGSINKSVFKDNKVYIITGGAGGIGLIFAEYIVKRNKCNIVLTGRSALNKEKQEKINQIVKNGSQIIYIQSDVTKKDSVTNLIKEVKAKYKKINGVIHSAGVLRDSFFINKSKRDFDTVLFPKVYGTMWLDEATKNEQLDFFVTFSSIAGTLGNIGQTDYSYANSFMDYFIKKREQLVNKKRRFGKSISINWPLWNDGGMTIHENTVEWLKENLGLYPLTSKKGIEGFEDALQSNNNQLIVVEGELEKLNKLFAPQEKIEIDKNIEKSQIKNIDKKVLKEKVEEYIKSLLSEETKLPVSKIDTEVDFEKYGIDSVMVMNFNREMESFFGNISKTLFYENQTISELANYLIKKYEHKVIKKFGTNQVENSNKESKKKNVSNVSGRKNKKELLKKRKTNSSTGLDKYEITNNNHDDIAIVGLSGKYPMAENLDIFWENLKLGKDCITEIPSDRWDYSLYYDPDKNKKGKTYSKWGGFIEGADKFDPLFFNISPREARYVDPQERIFLQTAWHTLEDAGYTREKVSGVSIGVFVGVMFGHYQLYGVEESMKGNVIGLSSSYASIANRVSYCLNLKGPSLGIDSMCSSSLTAIHMAIQSILKGDCEVAIAGGVNVISHPNKYILLSQNNFPSTDGKCRSFGDGGDGYVPGEGTGAILLKPLKKAIIDNDRIYGVIKGSALNHGGKTSGYSVPNPNAQSSLISKVLKDANIDARTISYIEAHGTGTALGDPIEITGLVNAFEKDTNDKQYCSIGSVKSNIGHTESAAGIAGLTKILLQMKYKELIPSIHSSKLNTNISFNETPFFVQQKNENWKKPVIDGIIYPRRAGISSFGAGGSNAHIIIEEYNQNNRIIEQENSKQIVVVSAKNEDRLKEYVNSLLDYLNNEEVLLTDIAYTLSVGREAMTNRIAIITSTVKELKEKLTSYINNDEIDDFYIGDLSQQKNNILLKDNDSKEYIKSLIKTKSLNTLAKMWIEGKKVYWEELYKNGRIMSLPTYPFAKERYWVPTLESSEEEIFIGESIGKLHPMVHRNTSTLEVQKFTTTLNGKEFFIEDHVIEGSNLLPGVAYIEMARIAGESSGLSTITKITNISFQRPIVIRDSICDVHICLYPNDNHIEYEVSTINGFGDSVVNSEGRIILENKIDNKDISVDINAIKDRCIRSISSYEIYEKFRKDKFNYGERLKPISNIYLGEGELISYLKLPDTVKLSSKEYGLLPTLFDGALQSVASLINNKDNIVFLPYSIGEVNIINHLNKDCFAHVICTVNEDDNKKFNIDVIDKDGKLIIRVKDFIVKARTKSISGKQNKNNNDLVDKKLNEDIFNGVERELLEKLQEDLIILVSKTLQIEQNKIDVKKDMSKYGFDSVTFTELGNIINRKFGLNVVPSTFYEHTTLLSVVKNFLMKYKETFKDYYINDLDEVINNSVSAKSEEPKKEVELLKPRQRYRSSAKNIKKYNEPIAIVGIGGVMPCSENLDEFWENLEQGKDLITEIPKDRWNWKEYYGDPTSEANKTNVKWGGFMKEVDKFDPLFFEISPREAELMDPQQRIFIETSWEAIEDAGYSVSSLSGSRTGVFVGVSTSDYSDL
jgi:polyketide synthase PksN